MLVALFISSGCSETAELSIPEVSGTNPKIAEPNTSWIPTVNIAPAEGWPEGAAPKATSGLTVTKFAHGLQHPRWVYVLPNGDALIAESNAPKRPEDGDGLRGWVMGKVMEAAGAAVPSANRITLLRDVDGDGYAETQSVFLEGLNSPFGMALVNNKLYVANTDAIVAYPYLGGQTKVDPLAEEHITDLPAGPINHHWTKNIIASPDGSKLYATVGSNSNIAENGISAEQGRASVWEVDLTTGQKREFATGLRNPNGMAWEPTTKTLFTVVNERDELGSDLVPDYLTSVDQGDFYGWPYSYYGDHIDTRVKPQAPEKVKEAKVPDYALGAHVAPLGLVYAGESASLGDFQQGMIVGLHGSWNRNPISGYKVVFVPFKNSQPTGLPKDILTGFVNADEKAYGRPVGVAIDRRGGLLVADDVGNTIWRVSENSNTRQ